MNKFELEDRLIKFAIQVLNISETIFHNYAGQHLAKQIIRSATSPALNYSEAIGAESRKDFAHKIKIGLKELRETFTTLKIIIQKPLSNNIPLTNEALKECNELICIFVASIKTANYNEINKIAKKSKI